MKFANILLATFGAILSTTDAANTLRRKKPEPDEKHVYLGTMITLTHVHEGNLTDVDATLLGDCFVHAFDLVSKNGFTIDSGFTSKTYTVPEEEEDDDDKFDGGPDLGQAVSTVGNRFRGYSSRMFISWWDARCRNCRSFDDDDIWDLTSATKRLLLGDGNAHKALEAELCNELRSSGDPMLAELTHCFIEFTYSSVMEEAFETTNPVPLPDDVSLATTTHNMRCHLMIDHVVGSQFSRADQYVIGNILSSSYNMIHSRMGFNMTDVQLQRRLDFPEVPSAVGPRDLFNRIWFIKATYECNDCHRLPPFYVQERSLHKAFEDLVCLKLKTSGLPAYRKASDCEISFVLEEPTDLFAMT